MLKRIAYVVLAALLALQLIRPEPNVSAEQPGPDDFIARYAPPPDVRTVLERACYDCHSNRTRYPWYAHVQPVGWWLAAHIEDGKAELNFSEFGRYSPREQGRKLNAISSELVDGTMPLPSYTWGHREAQLSAGQVDAVTAWMDDLYDRLAPPE